MLKLDEVLSFFSLFFHNDVQIRLFIEKEHKHLNFHVWQYETDHDIVKPIKRLYSAYKVKSFSYMPDWQDGIYKIYISI